MKNPADKLSPMIGLFGADVLIVVRLSTSHLGRTGKEIGFAIAAALGRRGCVLPVVPA